MGEAILAGLRPLDLVSGRFLLRMTIVPIIAERHTTHQ